MAIRAFSKAVVAAPRLERSVLTRATIPPTGRAAKAGLMVTMPVRAERMVGFMASTASMMDVPSSTERGRGVIFCHEMLIMLYIVFPATLTVVSLVAELMVLTRAPAVVWMAYEITLLSLELWCASS